MHLRAAFALAAALALAHAPARAQGGSAAAEAPVVAADAGAPAAAPLRLALSSPLGLARARQDAERISRLLADLLHRPVAAEVVGGGEIARTIADGKVDLGWLSAMQYVEAARVSGGQVHPAARLMRGGLPFYRSVLFTRRDQRGLSTPEQLKGKRLAFVSENSAAGYVLPRLVLLSAGLTLADLKAQGHFYGDHAAVCAAVAEGRADAGATISNDRAGGAIAGCVETIGDKATELKVISISDPIPNDVIAVRPGFSLDDYAALRTALLALGDSAEGKKALGEVFFGEAFVPSQDGDFTLLREMVKK
jgi:phosphonate transport system substrate-binding protein